jgi:hypothetical protein
MKQTEEEREQSREKLKESWSRIKAIPISSWILLIIAIIIFYLGFYGRW